MKYFTIPIVKAAIEHLQEYKANWLLPAFVFAANDVGTSELVDLSKVKGTDQFLDRYFNGSRLDITPFPSGNNLLRPRLKGIQWNRGDFSGDHMIRQDTKMWGNLFSSRGYREMRQRGELEGEKNVVKLTDTFQDRFEEEVPDTFEFERFLVWLFAFEGFPDEISNWKQLYDHFLNEHLNLTQFGEAYRNRFRVRNPELPWPDLTSVAPNESELIQELAPKLWQHLNSPITGQIEAAPALSDDDETYAIVSAAIANGESLAFLLAGPPGTGKTYTARLLARKLTGDEPDRMLYLQFHPALSYDDFVEGFRPEQTEEGQGVFYKLDTRLFLKFAEDASKNPTNRYVIVVDEINRGDVARIFGEVLTYIEPDYRGTHFTLPYSGKSVTLPKNLVILATANPYDRSVTDLDDALLRRFWLIELNPDAAFLRNHLQQNGAEEGVVNRTVQLFSILNQNLPHGYGHTTFLKVRTLDDLAAVWLGRARMTLRRGLLHDPDTFRTVEASIEELLQTKADEGELEADSVPEG